MDGAVLFNGSSNPELGLSIASKLGMELGEVHLSRFADGEICIHFPRSLRGKNVFIIQSTAPPVNENLVELLLMISTCRRSSAHRITAVVPYYGYARQDRKLASRVPISAADVAVMMQAMGVDRVMSVDLHCGQIQGFFGPRVPMDNLEAQKVAIEYFAALQLQRPIIVSPDAGGVYRARRFQEGLEKTLGLEKGTSLGLLIKHRLRANEIESMQLVGCVANCDVIIVDDMIDTAGTLCAAAKILKDEGALKIYAFATHGLFNGPAITRITNSAIDRIVITDSIRATDAVQACPKIVQLSIDTLLASAIKKTNAYEAIGEVFMAQLALLPDTKPDDVVVGGGGAPQVVPGGGAQVVPEGGAQVVPGGGGAAREVVPGGGAPPPPPFGLKPETQSEEEREEEENEVVAAKRGDR